MRGSTDGFLYAGPAVTSGGENRHAVLLGVNVNLQYASIPKRRRARMVACLEELLAAIDEEQFPVSLFFTGISAEWLARHRSDVVEQVRRLGQRKLVRTGSHTYAHAVLPLLPERDQVWQVQWGNAAVADVFGSSEGVFVPEFGFSDAVGRTLAHRSRSSFVIGPLGPRAIEAFRVPFGTDHLLVTRPSAHRSKQLKAALMGKADPPRLYRSKTYFLVSDAEYPYFATGRRNSWHAALARLGERHRPCFVTSWLDPRVARLPIRPYRPRIPEKHRSWFQGVQDFDTKLATARERIDDGSDKDQIRSLLLSENSDGYECMTQGYQGHGWDADAWTALRRALRR